MKSQRDQEILLKFHKALGLYKYNNYSSFAYSSHERYFSADNLNWMTDFSPFYSNPKCIFSRRLPKQEIETKTTVEKNAQNCKENGNNITDFNLLAIIKIIKLLWYNLLQQKKTRKGKNIFNDTKYYFIKQGQKGTQKSDVKEEILMVKKTP